MTEERRNSGPPAARLTEWVLDALRREGIERCRSVRVIRPALGSGGSGHWMTFADRFAGAATVVETRGALRIYQDDFARSRLHGAGIDTDDKENEGFLLDHPDAAHAAFC